MIGNDRDKIINGLFELLLFLYQQKNSNEKKKGYMAFYVIEVSSFMFN